MTTVALIAAFVLLVMTGAAWDILRKHIARKRFDDEILARLSRMDREIEKQHEQQQQVLGKLHATMAATSMRSVRAGGAR